MSRPPLSAKVLFVQLDPASGLCVTWQQPGVVKLKPRGLQSQLDLVYMRGGKFYGISKYNFTSRLANKARFARVRAACITDYHTKGLVLTQRVSPTPWTRPQHPRGLVPPSPSTLNKKDIVLSSGQTKMSMASCHRQLVGCFGKTNIKSARRSYSNHNVKDTLYLTTPQTAASIYFALWLVGWQ